MPVIDLFAGPGGLGEGFSALSCQRKQAFRVALSIEMEDHAHRTLELRSFFRQFSNGKAPAEYYRFLRGEISRMIFSSPGHRRPPLRAKKHGRPNSALYLRRRWIAESAALSTAGRTGSFAAVLRARPILS